MHPDHKDVGQHYVMTTAAWSCCEPRKVLQSSMNWTRLQHNARQQRCLLGEPRQQESAYTRGTNSCTCESHKCSEAPLVPGGRLLTAVLPQFQDLSPWLWQALRPPCHRRPQAVPVKGGRGLPPQSWQPSSRERSVLPLCLLMFKCKHCRCKLGKCSLAGFVFSIFHYIHNQIAAADCNRGSEACLHKCWPKESRPACTHDRFLGGTLLS